jgi:hypothetical protein
MENESQMRSAQCGMRNRVKRVSPIPHSALRTAHSLIVRGAELAKPGVLKPFFGCGY